MNPKIYMQVKNQKLKDIVHIVKYGYTESDVWNINYWFLKNIPNLLDDMVKNIHSYPSSEGSVEQWVEILQYMSWNFREAHKMYFDPPSHTTDLTEYYMKLDKHISVGLELFSEYFSDLWD